MPVNNGKTRGWVFYDAGCRFCVAGRTRWGPLFERRGFVWLPLQTPGAAERLGVTQKQLLAEMWLQRANGRVVSGVNSWSTLMRAVWWLWPLGVLLAMPGINGIAAWMYRWIARNRHCLGGVCKIHSHRPAGVRATDVVLVGLVVAAVWISGRDWPGWVFMWAIAFTLGLLGKRLAWRDARSVGCETPVGRAFGWFLLWPGLDGRAFFNRTPAVSPKWGEWAAAFVKLAVGVGLIWWVSPHYKDLPLARGWCAMVGIVLVLHFGLFHLLSLAWRAGGVNAAPIMDRPLAATSLAQLWGERWNTAFSIPSRRMVFQPLARCFGAGVASFVVFAGSGVLHDLVISVPARGGYGLPTAYFLLQGLGVWFERSRAGRALGLGSGVRGWLFTFILAAGPAFWLFHPSAVRNIILPMLDAIGAT